MTEEDVNDWLENRERPYWSLANLTCAVVTLAIAFRVWVQRKWRGR